ncbi:MAG TPA: hemolysin family protein [Gemmatimonadaceae bacterium]|nr:hemolysin family protein [Gemmatimonadaceae bacterium]
MTLALLILLAIALLGALSAAASAVRSVSRIWLRHWAEAHAASGTTVESPGERRERFLAAALAGIAAVITGVGVMLGTKRGAIAWQLVGDLVLVAIVLLFLGELLPRAIARRWASRLMPVVLPALRALELLLAPVLRAARWATHPLGKRSPAPEGTATDEMETLLREGEREGIGEPEEIEIISGLMQFQGKTLRDVMTPRTEIFALPESTPPGALACALAQSGYSRVPVYRDSLDEIVGVIHVLDILKHGAERMPAIRQVAEAPASKVCTEMLIEMLRTQRHLAVVLDEFGGTAGIVTLEDLLEEVVGEIRDEHDEPAGDASATPQRALLVDASTEIGQVAERLEMELPETERSIGGLLTRALGRIPSVGERFRFEGLDIIVVEAEQARVKRVLIQRADAGAPVPLSLPR